MRIISFGLGSRLYTFPDEQSAYTNNFTNLMPITSKLPGQNGGFDELGDQAAPSELGNVSIDFTLVAEQIADMEIKRDAVRAMAGWGVQKLLVQPVDTSLAPRWCYARLNAAPIFERIDEHTELMQIVSCKYQVAYPRWYSVASTLPVWGAFTWGSGKKWGTLTAPLNASGLSTSTTLTTIGTAETQPRIAVYCDVGQTVTNPIIQRLVNNQVADQVQWLGTLVAGDLLVIYPEKMTVKKNGSNAYSSGFSYLVPDWFRLLPGSNSIKVLLANSGDAAKVTFTYKEAYY